jgi:hypothetical protein
MSTTNTGSEVRKTWVVGHRPFATPPCYVVRCERTLKQVDGTYARLVHWLAGEGTEEATFLTQADAIKAMNAAAKLPLEQLRVGCDA